MAQPPQNPPPPDQPAPQWQQPPQPPQPQWQPPPPQPPQPQWDPPPPPQWEPTPQWQDPPPAQHWQGQPPQEQQWQGQPQQQWQQPATPVIPGPTLGIHLKRAFDWNVAKIGTTPREEQQLDAAGVERRLHGLYVWRRSTLLIALPVLLLTVVLNFYNVAHNGTDGDTGFGALCAYLPPIALLFVPLGSIIVIRNWTEMRHSSKRLLVCWLISIAIPLFVALMPLEFRLDTGQLKGAVAQAGGTSKDFEDVLLSLKVLSAVGFALTLLPVVLSIPGGVLKGAGRIKSLFPSAALPGWFLVAVAPFYSLFMIVVFVLLDQVVGNAVLLIGVALLAFAPWLYVIHRNVYGRPLSVDEADAELTRASRWGGWITWAGIALVVIFALSHKVGQRRVVGSNSNKAFFTYIDVLRTVSEVLARGMVTAVVFSTIFLFLVYAEWRTMTEFAGTLKSEHDAQISALERYMVSRAAPFNPAEWPAEWQQPPEQATWTGPPAS
jgi:hypothetical protein